MEQAPDAITLDDIQQLYKKPAYVSNSPQTALSEYRRSINSIREQAVFDEAVRVGALAGMASQVAKIKKVIKSKERELDTIYHFQPLMIDGRVVPPVISEMRDIYTQDDEHTLRLSGVRYQIVSQARFASTPPNWRGYLTLPEANTSALVVGIKPQNSGEEEIWRFASKLAWQSGVDQANLILDRATDNLNRDFVGMLRYHKMVSENRITAPKIAAANLGVVKESDSLVVDDALLRITQLPDFDVSLTDVGGRIVGSSFGGQPSAVRAQKGMPEPKQPEGLADRIYRAEPVRAGGQ